MSVTPVRRERFARASLMRQSIPNDANNPCPWCGARPRTLTTYWWQQDSANPLRIKGGYRWFCDLACHRAFYGE